MRINLCLELLDDVIAEAVAQITRRNPDRSIRVDLKDDLLMAYMDARLIVLVLLNILNNAVKHTPPDSHIVISGHQEGEMAVIEIADDGPGISDDMKPRLFDMFYTDNNGFSDRRRGLGLGLALCKSIVAAHNGTIWVKDNLPKGSVFGFSLRAKEK
jgi:two-component system sensor histidine kinase KdpD